MIGTNLFGEDQEYYDPEIERVKALGEKIKKLIQQNEDYEMLVDTFYGSDPKFMFPPTFEEFWAEQKDHLIKLHDKSKDWDDFIGMYYFCDSTKQK